jgi:serine/threonine-protein kinase
MRGVCSALAAAHAKKIVHRDLKPDNIFVIPDPDSPMGERTKILDFGIAKLSEIGLAGTATKTGAVMGTPTYMSPEQCRGAGEVDHRADIYSIGCMLYELTSGRPPFVNEGAGELIGSHLFVEPEPLSKHASVSPEFEQLVMRLLHKKAENRVQTATELAQLLVAIAQHHGLVSPSTSDPLGRFSMPHAATRPVVTPVAGLPMVSSQTAPAAVSAPKPTTLGSATGQSGIIDTPKRSRTGVFVGLGAALAIGAGVIAFLAVGGEKHADETDPTPAAEVRPAAPPTPTPPPAPPPVQAKPAKPVEPPPAPPIEQSKPVEVAAPAIPKKPPPPNPPAKPIKKPTKPVKPKGSLIETDL